jgi:hypothetical protein
MEIPAGPLSLSVAPVLPAGPPLSMPAPVLTETVQWDVEVSALGWTFTVWLPNETSCSVLRLLTRLEVEQPLCTWLITFGAGATQITGRCRHVRCGPSIVDGDSSITFTLTPMSA